jgi:hypothetical protein
VIVHFMVKIQNGADVVAAVILWLKFWMRICLWRPGDLALNGADSARPIGDQCKDFLLASETPQVVNLHR